MTFLWNDVCNALVESVGAGMVWWNVWRLYQHKSLRGVTWQSQAWGLIWNGWHLIYYTSLSQWCSFLGEMLGAVAVLSWLALAWCYRGR